MHHETDDAAHSAAGTETAAAAPREHSSAKLFDVRTVIGGLFLVYGVLIGGAGVFAGEEALRKAQGININLWTGVAMLVVGLLFLLWLKLRPLRPAGTAAPTDEELALGEAEPTR